MGFYSYNKTRETFFKKPLLIENLDRKILIAFLISLILPISFAAESYANRYYDEMQTYNHEMDLRAEPGKKQAKLNKEAAKKREELIKNIMEQVMNFYNQSTSFNRIEQQSFFKEEENIIRLILNNLQNETLLIEFINYDPIKSVIQDADFGNLTKDKIDDYIQKTINTFILLFKEKHISELVTENAHKHITVIIKHNNFKPFQKSIKKHILNQFKNDPDSLIFKKEAELRLLFTVLKDNANNKEEIENIQNEIEEIKRESRRAIEYNNGLKTYLKNSFENNGSKEIIITKIQEYFQLNPNSELTVSIRKDIDLLTHPVARNIDKNFKKFVEDFFFHKFFLQDQSLPS